MERAMEARATMFELMDDMQLRVMEQSLPVSIDTCGSSFDTEIGVYILVDGNLVLQTSNDDNSFCPVGTLQSRVIFTFDAGVEYFIVVVRGEGVER